MLREALGKLKWETRNIGTQGISCLRNENNWRYSPNGMRDCVFILGAWTTPNDQSWFLSYNDKMYHNGEDWWNQGPSFAICNPITDVIVTRPCKRLYSKAT